jgi:hypothetical protein
LSASLRTQCDSSIRLSEKQAFRIKAMWIEQPVLRAALCTSQVIHHYKSFPCLWLTSHSFQRREGKKF